MSGNQSRRLLRDVDLEWVGRCHRSGLSSGEGLIWAVRDPIEKQQPIKQHGRVIDYQLVVEDPGITDKRLLVTEAEFASTLRVLDDGNTLSALLRQAWDGQDLGFSRRTVRPRPRPRISACWCISREMSCAAIWDGPKPATDSATGFCGRAYDEPVRCRMWGTSTGTARH